MDASSGKLFIRCEGAHCDQIFEGRSADVSTCHDQGKVYFGIFGECPRPGCRHRTLVRCDEFPQGTLQILCPKCAFKTPVESFEHTREEGYLLSFSAICGNCGVPLSVTFSNQG